MEGLYQGGLSEAPPVKADGSRTRQNEESRYEAVTPVASADRPHGELCTGTVLQKCPRLRQEFQTLRYLHQSVIQCGWFPPPPQGIVTPWQFVGRIKNVTCQQSTPSGAGRMSAFVSNTGEALGKASLHLLSSLSLSFLFGVSLLGHSTGKNIPYASDQCRTGHISTLDKILSVDMSMNSFAVKGQK